MSDISSFSPTENSAQLISQVALYLDNEGMDLVERALELASFAHGGHQRLNGAPYINHAIAVAEILASWHAPAEVVAAGLLHDVAKGNYSNTPLPEQIEAVTGAKVAGIVQQMARLGRLGPLHQESGDENTLNDFDNVAHQIPWATLVLQQEPSAIVIKIADRLDNFRTLDELSAERKQGFALGARNIFVPFAERMGMRQAKRDLEDYAFRILQPETYLRVVEQYPSEACEAKLAKALTTLQGHFSQQNLNADICCAPYSYNELYRLEGQQTGSTKRVAPPILVLVEDEETCYQALRVIHQIWRPRPGAFQDLISIPKINGYRALHTTVRSVDGENSLVLIRNSEMHQVAEFGVTAQWQGVREDVLPRLPSWSEPPPGMIAVFTPDGELIQLPEGACAVDFAYDIHPDLGHRCSGAIINGNHSTLDSPLKTGDVVKILTSAAGAEPPLNWLKFVKTPKAKREIKKWTEKRNPAEATLRGRKLLDTLLRDQGSTLSAKPVIKKLSDVSRELGYAAIDDLYVAVGLGERSADDVVKQLMFSKKRGRAQTISNATIVSLAASNYPHRLARCCRPRPPDTIVGYVTKNKRVTIHRDNCRVARRLDTLVAAEWNTNAQHQVTEIEIAAVDRQNLVADVSTFISKSGLYMTGFHADSIEDGSAHIQVDFESVPTERIESLMDGLQKIPEVRNVNTTALRLPNRYAHGAVVERQLRNPYTLRPVKGSHFFGRRKDFQELLDHLRQIRPGEAILMWGPRRIGKTSLLLHFQHSILNHEDYVVAYLNLQELAGRTTTAFLWKIMQEITDQLQQGNISAPRYGRMEHEPLGFFSSFMDNVLPKSQKHVVLLLDEFQLISTLRPDKATLAEINFYFRNLMQTSAGITIIFSGGGVLSDLRRQSGAVNLLEVSCYQKIGPLAEEDARTLITKPVRFTLGDDAVDRLVGLTSGHPYFLQLLCSELHTHASSCELSRIALPDVEAFLSASLPEQAEHYFSHLWGEGMIADVQKQQNYKLALVAVATTANEDRWCNLEAIARTGAEDRLGESGLWHALRDLTAMDTLEGNKTDEFRINVELCQRWLQQHYTVAHVVREMTV